MAINVYTGVMGSGKSFEVTLNVVLPAILKGRRVVSNVDGLSEEKIHAYLRKKNPSHQGELGSIVHVADTDIAASGFFPDENKPELATVVQAGDLIVVDEAWRFWSADKKLSEEHMQFFRMHRHHTHPETGVSCDLALVFQSIGDVNRSLKAVIEMNFRTTKLKTLGLNRSYRIEWWEGSKQTKASFVGRRVTRYDKAIFPLYKSYGGAGGNEVAVDSRQNIFNNSRLWMMIFSVGGLSVFGAWWLWGFFHPESASTSASASVTKVTTPIPSAAGKHVPSVKEQQPIIEKRIGGMVSLSGEYFVMVVERSGRVSYDSTYNYSGRGVFLTGEHEGKRIHSSPFVD